MQLNKYFLGGIIIVASFVLTLFSMLLSSIGLKEQIFFEVGIILFFTFFAYLAYLLESQLHKILWEVTFLYLKNVFLKLFNRFFHMEF